MKKLLVLSLGLLTLVPGAYAMESKKPALSKFKIMRFWPELALTTAGIAGMHQAWTLGKKAGYESAQQKAEKNFEEAINLSLSEFCDTPQTLTPTGLKQITDAFAVISNNYNWFSWSGKNKIDKAGMKNDMYERALTKKASKSVFCLASREAWLNASSEWANTSKDFPYTTSVRREKADQLFKEYSECIDNFKRDFNKV